MARRIKKHLPIKLINWSLILGNQVKGEGKNRKGERQGNRKTCRMSSPPANSHMLCMRDPEINALRQYSNI